MRKTTLWATLGLSFAVVLPFALRTAYG